ncbi:ABC transporter ATP-binding protein [Motilibacter aurantiacus]|uniref:ABC transporter ATP-binding protein n=1 Tax=Motilibacter aurantiacus TaxID=2714955 RepID=UPI00140CD160|nr:ABC transporter ATP-binding protein [Motilibacter aurantiacus]
MPTPAAVEVTDLVKRYASVRAVDGLSLRVERGTVTAVLGPNGAGKTTTIETCEGYRRPDAGQVRVLGLDPVRDARQLRPRVGVMLQGGGVPNAVRPLEVLRHAAALHAHPLDPQLLIERLGLRPALGTPYRRLSGGQQQRLALALAVIGRPELVFLDEPTAGLDPQARHATWDLVNDLRAAGVTVVLTTHLLDEAERLADMVHVIDAGRVVASGTPAELTARGPDESLTFDARPGLDLADLLLALPEGASAVEALPGRYRVAGPMTPQTLATVTAWCAAHGVMPEGLSVGRRTLEDVFLDVTGRELRA